MKVTTKEKIETIFEQLCSEILNSLKHKSGNRNIIIRLDTAKLSIDRSDGSSVPKKE